MHSMNEVKINPPTIDLPDVGPVSAMSFPNGHIQVARSNYFVIPKRWERIPAIHHSRSMTIDKPEQLVHIVELPLYPSAVLLHQAGIVTTESNAHFEAGEDKAVMLLGIRWDSLSDNQKRAAERLVREHPDRWRRFSEQAHGDGYEALYLHWTIQKDQFNPSQVEFSVRSDVERLIRGVAKVKRPD